MSSQSSNIFLSEDDTININVRATEHETSDGPYAVVKVEFGTGVALTIFPKGEEQIEEFVMALRAAASNLETLRLGPAYKGTTEAVV